MEGEARYLTKSAFAALRGWAPSYVTKLKDQGRLVLDPDGKLVDVEATIARLERTGDPGKEAIRQHHAQARTNKHVDAEIRPDAPAPVDAPESASADPTYWAAKARRENTLADLARLELARKHGELVERQRVEDAAFTLARTLRDAILQLPTQLAPELVPMTDAFQIENRLRDALRQILADMSKISVTDLSKAMEQSH